jgi:hypothetical protein
MIMYLNNYKMLPMENCESLEERLEPLLNTLPTKQQYL